MRNLGKLFFVFLVLGSLCIVAPLARTQEKETGTTETTPETGAADVVEEAVEEGETPVDVPPEVTTEGEKTAEEIAAEIEAEKAIKEGEKTAEDEMLAEKNKQEAAGHFEKALAARDAKSLAEAVAELLQAKELDPENATYAEQLQVVQSQYINELLDEGDYALAISVGQKHLEMFPDDTTVKNLVSSAEELQKGTATEVVEGTSKEDIIPPPTQDMRSPSELYDEARALYSLKDYEESRKLLEKARELDPSAIKVNLLLYDVNEKLYKQAWQNKRAMMKSILTDVELQWLIRPRTDVEVPMDLAEPPEKAMPESRKKIMEKLNTIIPKVEFTDAKLKEVIDYLSKKVDVSIVIDEGVFRAGPAGIQGTPPFGGVPNEFGDFGPTGSMPGPGTSFPGGSGSMPSGTGLPTTGSGLTPPTGTGIDETMPTGTGFDPTVPTGTGFDTGFTPTDTTAITQPVDIGGITITLKDVPLKEVLKYVLRMKELKYVVDDYAIVIMRSGDVLPEDFVTEIFRLSTSGLGPGQGLSGGGTSSFGRSGSDTGIGGGSGGFGTGSTGFGGGSSTGGFGAPSGESGGADTIKDFLLSSGVAWPRGSSIIYHQPTATLIVTNTPTQLALIRELIRIYDMPPMQVEIEARFVEVQLNKLFENTFQIGMTNALQWARKSDLMAGKPLTSLERINMLFDPRQTVRTASTVKGTSGNILSISGILTEPEFSIVWNALDQNQYSELLNAPRVTTISGQQAQIQVVEEIRYPTDFEVETLQDIFIEGGVGEGGLEGFTPFFVNPTNFETREVGTLLTVTPTVSADGRVITLVLFPEVSELLGWDIYGGSIDPTGGSTDDSGSGSGGTTFTGLQAPQPRFGSRNITTTVYVNDGETIVLGGLITERTARYKDKVPIFGSIPFVGRLFRNELDDTYKRNLIIFVTARLITSRGTMLKDERKVTEMLHARAEEAKKKAEEEAAGTMGTSN